MFSKKIKLVALASTLFTGVLASTALVGSYVPNLAKGSSPTYSRRATFSVNNENGTLKASQLEITSKDGGNVNQEYAGPFNIQLSEDEANNSFNIKLNSTKTKFAVANIQSMCIVNLGRTNIYSTFAFHVGSQHVASNPEKEKDLYPLYKDVTFNINGSSINVPGQKNPNDPHFPGGPMGPNDPDFPGRPGVNTPTAVYFDLSSISGDVTEFTMKIDKSYLQLNEVKCGISFVYGCENR